MSRAPFICSRCLLRLSRPSLIGRQGLRFQSASSTTAGTTGSLADSVVSPFLLRRAENLAAEFDKLSKQNAEEYDTNTAKRIGELAQVAEVFRKLKETEEANTELESVLAPTYPFKELQPDARAELDHNVTTIVPQLARKLETSLIPPHPFAQLPALVEIHPGAGGSEASLFAANLARMYLALCSRLGLSTQILKWEEDDSVSGEGLVDAIIEISSPGAYDLLRTEAGVHRVQRVPATEKKGRTHTSAVSVLVLPSFTTNSNSNSNSNAPISDSDDLSEDPTSTAAAADPSSSAETTDPTSPSYIFAPSTVRVETMRARGAGGQHVNKTSSAIRLTHFSSGIVISMQESRSQHSNRAKAWQILRARLAQRHREEKEREAMELRRKIMGGVGKTDRGDKVRTYNWEQQRVSDHRSGGESRDLDGVLEGGEALTELMGGVKVWMGERELEAVVLEEEAKNRAGQ